MISGGYIEALAGAPKAQILVNSFHCCSTLQCEQDGSSGAKIGGSGVKIGASGVKIGALVPTAQKVILTHGGYFEALSGAPKDPSFGQLFFYVVELQTDKMLDQHEGVILPITLTIWPSC